VGRVPWPGGWRPPRHGAGRPAVRHDADPEARGALAVRHPGTPGNFAVAAHDITAGNPFLHLGSLRPGDAVLVQVAGTTYRYAVTSSTIVRYTDTAVLDPVPGHPGTRPTAQYITLITCSPVTLVFTPWRIIVTGHLIQATLSR
jgi:sortase A